VFSGLRPKESIELARRIDFYAGEHKDTIFMITVETSSIMLSKSVIGTRPNPLGNSESAEGEKIFLKEMEDKLNNGLECVSAGGEERIGEINRIVRQRVPALDHSPNYTLLPFSPLTMKMANWEHVLPLATKKKLVDGANRILQVLRRTQLFVEFSPKIVDTVINSAFGRESSGGMRMINNYWLPLTFETIRHKCPRTCMVMEELFIDTDGKTWSCQCQSLVSIQRIQNLLLRNFLGILHWANENDDTLDKVKTLLLALF